MTANVVPKTWEVGIGPDGKWRSKPPLDNIAPTVPTNPLVQVVTSSLLRVSWTASTDSQSGVAYYIVERSLNGTTGWTQVGTPATTTYDDGSVAAGTQYYYRVKAVDGSPLANTSAASSVVNATTPAGAALQWAVLEPPYEPIIPGLAGFGMDQPAGFGSHLTTPATNVFIVNTLSNDRALGTKVQSNPSVYRCSLPYACQSTLPGIVVFEVSGVIDLQRTQNVYGRWKAILGQTAPSPGIFIKNGSLAAKGGDQLFMHLSNYNGDEASGQDSGARRGMSMGQTGTSNYVAAWCTAFWFSDQAFDCSVGGSNFTIVHCLAAEALCDSIHPKGPHGYGVLLEANVTKVTMVRNIIAHVIDRDPLTRAHATLVGNNLAYNAKGQNINMPTISSPTGKGGYGLNPSNEGPTTDLNIESNFLIKGPNFSAAFGGNKPMAFMGQTSPYALLAGSKIYLAGNHAFDFGTITTQNDLWTAAGTLPANLISSTRLSSAWPEGMQLLDPKSAGYAQLMTQTCGARPGDRTAGRDATVCSHILNKLAGSGSLGTGINTPPSGPITAANNTRDLFNSTLMLGDPMPNGTDRDAIQASGRSKLYEWSMRWHDRVMP